MPIWKSKTFWTAIGGVCTAAGAYFEGSLGLTGLISAVFGGLAVIFMRQGVQKSGPAGVPPLEARGEEVK